MDVQALKLAFTYHMLQQVAAADAHVDDAELAHLTATFTPEVMRAAGFQDDEGRWTDAFYDARDLAVAELPDRLEVAEKLAVLEVLVDACAADRVLEPAEADVLAAAARMLEVPDDDWTAYVDDLVASGRMTRGT